MKASEAPEKIYLSDFTDTTESVFYVKQDNTKKTDFEYTRTDAFIEKACNAYCRLCDTKECGDTGECDWVEKFRKRLMK